MLMLSAAPAGAQENPMPGLSAARAQTLADHLAKRQDTKALTLLTTVAKKRRWCELTYPLKSVSHRIRLFADLTHLARKRGKFAEAWTCLEALMTPASVVFDGGAAPPALGLTVEAGILYEASLVFPRRVAGETPPAPDGPPLQYKRCDDLEYQHTETFLACVLDIARRHKASDTFDPAALEQVLLVRSAELVPRPSVLAKLTPERRREVLKNQLVLLDVRASTSHRSAQTLVAGVAHQMLQGANRCRSRADLESGDCVYFEMVGAQKLWTDAEGSWQTYVALSRNDNSAYGDSCYTRRLYLVRSGESTPVYAARLTDLGPNQICGSGGWGDWEKTAVISHDASTGIVVVEVTGGHVFKAGGSALRDDGMSDARTVTRFTCGSMDGGFTCLVHDVGFHEIRGDSGTTSWIRRGVVPAITFPGGKAVLKRLRDQFTFSEYDQLEGLSFAEVVERLPAIHRAIHKRVGAIGP